MFINQEKSSEKKSKSILVKSPAETNNITSPVSKRKRRSSNPEANVAVAADVEDIDLSDDFTLPRRNPASRLLDRPTLPVGRPVSFNLIKICKQ